MWPFLFFQYIVFTKILSTSHRSSPVHPYSFNGRSAFQFIRGSSAAISTLVYHYSATLIHKYTFNDGTTLDSVGGSDWAGTLGATASISDSALVLPGVFSSSYMSLPAGICLSKYIRVHIAFYNF